MLALYTIRDSKLADVGRDADVLSAAWIDMLEPTVEEEREVEKLVGAEVPTREEMSEIEVSSRLYREREAVYMTASLLARTEGAQPIATPVTFILAGQRLLTVRYSDPSVFRSFVKYAEKEGARIKDGTGVFLVLLEAIIDRAADILEQVGSDVDTLSRNVFTDEIAGRNGFNYRAVLRGLGLAGDLNSKCRESLVSIGRLVNFFAGECSEMHPELRERLDTMAADIRSLTDHSSYIANSIVFLLDATLGLISIEQNDVIKILSVVSVLIMPPMLIASIYGMNFEFMPELHWRFGYPLALVAMAITGLIPYAYFKRRGWM